MKPWLRCWLGGWVVVVLTGAASTARGGFTISDLGPGGGMSGGATGINASGAASGTVIGGGVSVAASTTANGGFRAIDTSSLLGATSSSAAAIDSAGGVAGSFYDSYDKQHHAFLATGGRAVDYGSFADPKLQNTSSWGVASNASGELLGTARLADGTQAVFRATAPGAFAAIALPGGSQVGSAAGLNNAGTAVGTYLNGVGVYKVFTAQEGRPAVDLLSQYSVRGFGLNSYASAINDRGDVAGYGDFNGQSHAFIAAANGKFTDIGVTGGFTSSASAGMNDLGQVVGKLGTGAGSHALLWDQVAGTFDLNTLLAPSDQAIWTLTSATGINDNDQIVGQGYLNGQLHGFLLTLTPGTTPFGPAIAVPAPPSAWMALAGLALASGWARLRPGRTGDRGTA